MNDQMWVYIALARASGKCEMLEAENMALRAELEKLKPPPDKGLRAVPPPEEKEHA